MGMAEKGSKALRKLKSVAQNGHPVFRQAI